MRTRVLIVFALVLLAAPASVRSSELFTTISVDVKEEWFNSGVYINAGDTLYLTGFGAFSAWSNQEIWFNVSSPGPFLAGPGFTVPGYPAPALIGRIGGAERFIVSGTAAFVSDWSGPLYFTVNDQTGAYADNRGTVIVWLSIRPLNTSGEMLPPAGEEIRLGQNQPNPFGEQTRIQFEVPTASRVVVGIHDEAGRLVRTLADKAMEAGSHTLVWDGRDNQARRVSSGTYFYRVDLGSIVGARQMVLVR